MDVSPIKLDITLFVDAFDLVEHLGVTEYHWARAAGEYEPRAILATATSTLPASQRKLLQRVADSLRQPTLF